MIKTIATLTQTTPRINGSNGLLLKVKVFKGGKFHSLGQL